MSKVYLVLWKIWGSIWINWTICSYAVLGLKNRNFSSVLELQGQNLFTIRIFDSKGQNYTMIPHLTSEKNVLVDKKEVHNFKTIMDNWWWNLDRILIHRRVNDLTFMLIILFVLCTLEQNKFLGLNGSKVICENT